jgi:glycosyltransferase involved in cell wall biosynthesis
VADHLTAAVVGVSTRPTCGVRDHAFLLAQALDRENVSCSMHWHSSTGSSLAARSRESRRWTRTLEAELRDGRFDAILLHYSVFSYSYRGVPLFVHPSVASLRGAGAPIVTIMHEIAYPWRLGGVRGTLWAASQRAALIELVRASAALVVTADFRAEWLRSRRWLPARPVAVAPVFSNLPRSSARPDPRPAEPTAGIFGYALDPATVSLVLDAVRRLRDRGIPLRLLLLGAPGLGSPAAAMWAREAESRGLGDALSISGVLAAQDLSDALAASDVLLFADRTGPVSRKGTLAGSLAAGRPLVVLEGQRDWPALSEAQAAAVIPRASASLAEVLEGLLRDQGARDALGARARTFAEDEMGVVRSAEIVRGCLDGLTGRRGA